MRLFKMVRLLKYNKNIEKFLDSINLNPGYFKLMKISATVILLVHLVSCFYFMVAKFEDFEPDTWVVRLNLADESSFTQYITAVYWAF